MPDIMFVSINNAGLSPMAAVFFNRHKTRANISATSAGIYPIPKIHRVVREVISEVGIDLFNVTPVKKTLEMNQTVDTVVTMAYGVKMGLYMSDIEMVYWVFTGPMDKAVEEIRILQDEVEQRVKEFIVENQY
ncbi:hypothetical protein BGX29_008680 [Mortierella sp. GBA35]|nr:hypothetical protein BGX29_008680 [Mortierella sp. GBA35]